MYQTNKLAQVVTEMNRYRIDIGISLVKQDGQD